ncbi:hypothetical protein B0H12DRAFT_1137902 [Mycena haematopus]|nr:hypothetical protein B0H12DRAFT_1137902 [Mycena haematopus]
MESPLALHLPPEILLDIAAYFHHPTLPYERRSKTSSDKILLGRSDVLRALSQTCLYFRRVFLSLVCEHMELLDGGCATVNIQMKRMTGVLKTSVWRCVRTVVVSLISSPQNSWTFPTVFVRFLAATSHLTSLHIVAISEPQASALTELLQGRSFHSVRSLAIPCSLARSLSSFPSIHSLTCVDNLVSDYHCIALLKASSKYCPSLEALVNLAPSLLVIKGLLKSHPLITTLRFRRALTFVRCLLSIDH